MNQPIYLQNITNRPDLYEQACVEWAQGLSNEVIRSLEADYRRGSRDESVVDAHFEFQRRGLRSTPGRKKAESASSYQSLITAFADAARSIARAAQDDEATPQAAS